MEKDRSLGETKGNQNSLWVRVTIGDPGDLGFWW